VTLAKTRAASNGGATVVQSDENLGSIYFEGADGTNLVPAARIFAAVDGTPGTNDMPGRLAFSTTADGASSPTERMRIDSSGNVGIGTVTPGYTLDVRGANTPAAYFNSGTANTVAIFESTDAGTAIELKDNTSSGFNGIQVQGNNFLTYVGGSERARIDGSGRLLVGTSSQSGGSLFQVNDDRIRIASSKTPASASDTGTAGEVCWDSSYIYVCTATNTWKRAALSTW